MIETSPLTLVRPPAWEALLRRLDAAVARDPRLADARDSVLGPVELLRVMAADAHGALADDVLRGDRLRAMLFLAWPYVAVAVEGRALLAADAPPASADATMLARLVEPTGSAGTATTGKLWPPAQPYEPGVIDHAALLVLAIAAARVADPPFAPVFVASVHGLALAASAAEVLGRLDPRQPSAESLDVVLHTLYLIEAARTVTRNEFLRPFVFDPVERGRWQCLAELTGGELLEAAVRLRVWDGATSDEILDIAPRNAVAGDTIVVTIRRPITDPDEPGGDPLRGATVVFASADGPLLPAPAPARVRPATATGDTLAVEVVVPDGASPGWLGFSRDRRIAQSNEARAAIRNLLGDELAHACVEGVGRIDPQRSIPDYGALATPRRRGRNRFEGGAPAVVYAGVTPALARPGEPVALRWETAGADRASITVAGALVTDAGAANGTLELAAPAADGDVAVAVTPHATRGGRVLDGAPRTVTLAVHAAVRIASVALAQDGRTSPLFAGRALAVTVRLDGPASVQRATLFAGEPLAPIAIEPGLVRFEIPAALARDGLTISVTVEDRSGGRDTRSVGPVALAAIAPAQIVLVRPAIVTGSTVAPALAEDTAHALVTAAAATAGLAATIVELPWVDDELAVLVDRPAGDSDPALIRVLEALARRALLTPRFERAIWLALVPDVEHRITAAAVGSGASIARSLPANAALAVAVATPGGLARLFAGLDPRDGKAAATVAGGPRLAILGTLDDHELAIEDVRVDDRGEGPGAPVKTSLTAVTIDTDGRELDRVPVRVLAASRPAALAILVPVSSNVGAIELRDDRGGVRKLVRRIPGELTLAVDKLAGNRLDWTWNHSHNARPRVSLVLRRDALATPVLAVDPCTTRVDLPLWRFAAADALALYATDGWNPVERPIDGEPRSNATTVVLRRLSDGRFFADVPPGTKVTWRLDGVRLAGDARTLELRPGDHGLLELVAERASERITESRRIEPR